MVILLQTSTKMFFALGIEKKEKELSIQDLKNSYGIDIEINNNIVNIQNNGNLETSSNDFIYNLTINKNDDVLTQLEFMELYKLKLNEKSSPQQTFVLNNNNVILLNFLHNSSYRRIIIRND